MRLTAILWLVFCGICAADPSASCVSVVRKDGGGSGTVVVAGEGRSLVLTCKHVCPDAGRVWVIAEVDGRKRRLPARWLGVSGRVDLAMLEVNEKLMPAVIADADPDVGEMVSHYGRASGPQSGRVHEFKLYADRTVDIQSEMLAVPGDSGAGVFDSRGRLCGVHHGTQNRADESENSLACQSSEVRAFVGRYAKGD